MCGGGGPTAGTPCFECHTPCRLQDMRKRRTDGKLLCLPCRAREEK